VPEHALAASGEMSFSTTRSGTGLAPGVATEIAEAMGNPDGTNAFFGDLINACVCQPGAPCAPACAQ
jgi:hypothetical protein